jgi:hypothetical protein
MDRKIPSSLEGLTYLGLRSGVDMRPTLLRVLTDLYVQKLTHTADEEHQYTELALRLLDSVDTATRAAVAVRLARHLAPPLRVIERLAADLPGFAGPKRAHPPLRQDAKAEVAKSPAVPTLPVATTDSRGGAAAVNDAAVRDHKALPPADLNAPIGPEVANELNELFFAANAEERRLILLNLEIVAPLPAGRVNIARDPAIAQRLERAVLARNREEFAQHLAAALNIPRLQASRIADDELGEPIVTVAKALGMPRDVVYRVLLFVNTAVGHSVERVHALANLYDDMTTQTAEHMVAIWQGLQKAERADERKPARYQPLLWNDEGRVRARTAIATVRRAPATQRSTNRRDVS